MIKESVNTFNEGVNYDLNPIVTPKNILTDCVNGTFITFNGDELALQNDAGNTRLGVTQIEHIEQIETVKYGLLYNWYTITDPKGITNAGNFSVPNREEFNILASYLGATIVDDYIVIPNNIGGTLVSSAFNAKFGGSRGITFNAMDACIFWSAESMDVSNAYHYGISIGSFPNFIGGFGGTTKNTGLYIRLVRLATIEESALLDYASCTPYIGNDGKSYPTIKIGNQVWLASNLAETMFFDGSYIHGYEGGIYQPISNENWVDLITAGVCAHNDNLTNIIEVTTEIIIDVPGYEVRLSEGFYPLGMKEYGGILYIVSGKNPDIEPIEFNPMYSYDKGEVSYREINEIRYYYESLIDDNNNPLPLNSNEYWLYIGIEKDFLNKYGFVEFGSYPSPEVVDPSINDLSIDYSIDNYPSSNPDSFKIELYNPKVINNILFRAGVYVNFFAITGSTLITTNISFSAFTLNTSTLRFIKDSDASIKKIYKVKLYQQLTNGIIDLTDDVWLKFAHHNYNVTSEELNKTGSPKFWFNDPDFKYYCPHNFKGKLMISLELEPFDEFSLQSTRMIFDTVNYETTFNLNFAESAGWNTTSPTVGLCWTVNGDEPNFDTITTTNFISTINPLASVVITSPAADGGKTLKYKIRPNFLIGVDLLPYTDFPNQFLDEHTISGNLLLSSDFENYKIVIDESAYMLDPLGTNARLMTRLILTDEIGNYLDNELEISLTPYEFYLSGTTPPTNSLGTYTIGADHKANIGVLDLVNVITPAAYKTYIVSLVEDTVVYRPFENWGKITVEIEVNRSFGAIIPIRVVQNSSLLIPQVILPGSVYSYEIEAGIAFTISPNTGLGLSTLYNLTTTLLTNDTIKFGLVTNLSLSRWDDPDTFYDSEFYLTTDSPNSSFGPAIDATRFTTTQTNPAFDSTTFSTSIVSGNSNRVFIIEPLSPDNPVIDVTFNNTTPNIYDNLVGETLSLEGANHLFLQEYIGLTA